VARSDARRIARSRLPIARPLAAAVHAGLATLEGDEARAIALLRAAIEGFDRGEMALYREAARLRLASSSGDPSEGARARAWMEAEGIVDPVAMAAALVPGKDLSSP
jgi:hypothetical protein